LVVLYYCPAPDEEASCENFNVQIYGKSKYRVHVSTKTTNKIWNTSFEARHIDREPIIKALQPKKIPLAVCVTIAYTSTDKEKAEVREI